MDYDCLAQMGNRGWSYDDLLPNFKSIETQTPSSLDNLTKSVD